MADLEYKIGAIEVDKKILEFAQSWARDTVRPITFGTCDYRFVVAKSDNQVAIYIAKEWSHKDIVSLFKITNVIGGGALYLDVENQLHIGGRSDSYGSVSKEMLENFAPLVNSGLKAQGLTIDSVLCEPTP